MTRTERTVKGQVITTNLEKEVLDHLAAIATLTSEAWAELDGLDLDISYTELNEKVVRVIRKYGF